MGPSNLVAGSSRVPVREREPPALRADGRNQFGDSTLLHGGERCPDVGLIAPVKMLCDLTGSYAYLVPHSGDTGHLSLERAKVRVIDRQRTDFARLSRLKLMSKVKRSHAQGSEEPRKCYVSRR